MRPQLLSGLRHLRRHPGRVLQTILAVALGVALFVSSYLAIEGIESSIRRTSRAVAGNAQWVVSGPSAASLPENIAAKLRQEPGVVAAPLISASATILGDHPEKLQVWGVDMTSDSMLRLFPDRPVPSPDVLARLMVEPNAILVPRQMGLRPGAILRVATHSGATDLNLAGTIEDSPTTLVLGGNLALMDLHQAQTLFGRPGMVDSIEVSGISQGRLKSLVGGYEVRPVDALSAAAGDALLRVQSLYGLSLVAILIGCFVVFSSVQVSVLERIKQLATFRAVGASRLQLLTAILVEWLLVGLAGSAIGVAIGFALSSVMLRAVSRDVNSLLPLVKNARAEITMAGLLSGMVIGLATVLVAALIPALGAVRESPLLALRPHTYRLSHRQVAAFWIGLAVLALGLLLSASGSTIQTLAAIAMTFLGMALLMPHAMVVASDLLRKGVARAFGFVGFLASDNLRKAPQRTAFNVIALGGALAIMVSAAAFVQGLSTSTHRWIRASLPLDISIAASDPSTSLYSDETVPRSLLAKVRHVPGVAFAYGVRKSFAPFRGHDIMVVGIPTATYLEAHRRRGSLDWARPIAGGQQEMRSGHGVFVSDNLLSLAGLRVGQSIALKTPSGPQTFIILGSIEDYSWPRGLVVTDLGVMSRLWHSTDLTFIDVQATRPSEIGSLQGRLVDLTRNDYAAVVLTRDQILALSDDVINQTTSAAGVQVWLAAVIGFLGIGNSLIIGVLQRQREIGLLRAVGISKSQLQQTVAVEALLVGVGAGLLGIAGGLAGGWLPLRHFTFAITGYLFPAVVPWEAMVKVFFAAIGISILAAIVPARRIAEVPVLTSIAVE